AERRATATNFPSGDQERPEELVVIWPSFRSWPPSAGITKMSAVEPRNRRKAMRPPSGDHAGDPASAGFVVSRRGAPASTNLMYISKLSLFSPSQENATCFPSGESAGSVCCPG